MPPVEAGISQTDRARQEESPRAKGTAPGGNHRSDYLEGTRTSSIPAAEDIAAGNSELRGIFERYDIKDTASQVQVIKKLLSAGLREEQIVRILDLSKSSPQSTANYVCTFLAELKGSFSLSEKYSLILQLEKETNLWEGSKSADLADALKQQKSLKEFSRVLVLSRDYRYPWGVYGLSLLLKAGLNVDQVEALPGLVPEEGDSRPIAEVIKLLSAGRSLDQAVSLINETKAATGGRLGRVLGYLGEFAKELSNSEIIDLIRFCSDTMGNGLNVSAVQKLLKKGESPDEIKAFVKEIGDLPCSEAFNLAVELRDMQLDTPLIRKYIEGLSASVKESRPYIPDFNGEGLDDPGLKGKIEFNKETGSALIKAGITNEDLTVLGRSVTNEILLKEAHRLVEERDALFEYTRNILKAPSELPLHQRMELCGKLGKPVKPVEVARYLSSDNASQNDRFFGYLSRCLDRRLADSACSVAFACSTCGISPADYEKLLDLVDRSWSGQTAEFVAGYLHQGFNAEQTLDLSVRSVRQNLSEGRFTMIFSMVRDLTDAGLTNEQMFKIAAASIDSSVLSYQQSWRAHDWVENLKSLGFSSNAIYELCMSAPSRQECANEAINSLISRKSFSTDQIREIVQTVEKSGGPCWAELLSFVPNFLQENGFKMEQLQDFVESVADLIRSNNLSYDLTRYPYALIKELIRTRKDPDYKKDAPTALIVFNQDDWNGAFSAPWRKYWESIIKAGFRIELFEATSDEELGRRIAQVGKGEGRIKFLMIGGHGNQTSLALGAAGGETARLDVSDNAKILSWLPHLSDGVQIELLACSNAATSGGAENNAHALAKALAGRNAQVFASPKPSNLEDIEFDESGRVKRVILMDADSVQYSSEKE